jgi:transcriptional regulator GlxA family with amidase domain
MQTRTVVALAWEGCQVLDVTGPAEVFSVAAAMTDGRAYKVRIASLDGGDVVSSSGVRIGVEAPIGDVEESIDTLLVPGGFTWPDAMHEEQLTAGVTAAARRSRRVMAVCAGAFIAGAAGLLDGRRVTTHWQFVDDLEARFPAAEVERGPIFVGDGSVFTSAGGTASIDLALALVEADHGPQLAREVAQFLVVFMQRSGGQDQLSVRLGMEPDVRSPVRALLDGIAEDPAGDHRLAALSERSGFSARHLTRVFARETGTTPARYVERVRIEAARAMLERSDAPLEVIARRSGLNSAETLRRRFTRALGVTPHVYRQRFRATWSQPEEAATDVLRSARELAFDRVAPLTEVPPALVVNRDREPRAEDAA